LTPPIVDFLKEHLNLFNADYAIKKNTGRSTWKTERYFRLIDETENTIEIPRGFIGNLVRFCKQQGIDHEFIDQRKRLNKVEFSSSIQLLKHQFHPVETTKRYPSDRWTGLEPFLENADFSGSPRGLKSRGIELLTF